MDKCRDLLRRKEATACISSLIFSFRQGNAYPSMISLIPLGRAVSGPDFGGVHQCFSILGISLLWNSCARACRISRTSRHSLWPQLKASRNNGRLISCSSRNQSTAMIFDSILSQDFSQSLSVLSSCRWIQLGL